MSCPVHSSRTFGRVGCVWGQSQRERVSKVKMNTYPCAETGCTGVITWPAKQGRHPVRCEACKGKPNARRARIAASKAAPVTNDKRTAVIAANAPMAQTITATVPDPVISAPVPDAIDAEIDELASQMAELVKRAREAADAAKARKLELPAGEIVHKQFPKLVMMLEAGTQPYLVGPAASGKSTAGRMAADVLGLSFDFMSCHENMGAHDFFGFVTATGTYNPGILRNAWERGGVVLIDEMDAGNSSALTALQGALALKAGDTFTFPDGACIPRHEDFRPIGGGNTTGHGADDHYVTRVQFDAAFRTRWQFLPWGYDEDLERETVPGTFGWWVDRVQQLRRAVAASGETSVMVTPRATIEGAKLLHVGMSQEDVEEASIWFGCPEDTKRAILAHVS